MLDYRPVSPSYPAIHSQQATMSNKTLAGKVAISTNHQSHLTSIPIYTILPKLTHHSRKQSQAQAAA